MIKSVMLASSTTITIDDLPSLRYPLYATEKLDGIRMHIACKDGHCRGFSRKNIEIPNMWVQEWCNNDAIANLDGELILPGQDFSANQSFFMTETPLPKKWEYHVFDHTGYCGRSYLQRLQILEMQLIRYNLSNVVPMLPTVCGDETYVESMFKEILLKGGEGLILRSAEGLYKQGRATLKEGTMMKMKTWEDAEATIIGFEPEYENNNPQQRDNCGQSKRSSHNANLNARERLGKLIVRSIGLAPREFSIGSGFTQSQKDHIWKNRNLYLGQTVTYKFQPCGTKAGGLPRTPIFKTFRRD